MPDIFVSPDNSNLPHDQSSKDFKEVATEKEIAQIGKRGTKLGIFTTFRENPAEVSYDDIDPDEEIILFLRRHFITNVPWLIQGAILLFLPFVISAVLAITNIFPTGI